MAALKKERTIRLMFSCCGFTLEVKLSTEWQIALLAKMINLDMTDGMVTLTALYWVENFKPSNKHLCFLTRHLGFVTRKVPVVDLKSLVDSV